MHCCRCCCDKSKRRVDADDDADPSDPLLHIARKEFTKKGDPLPKRGSLMVRNSVGDLEIDSDDGTLSDLSGGVPKPLDFPQRSVHRNSSMNSSVGGSVGDITIPDEVLTRRKSLETLKRDVSIAAARKTSVRNIREQSKKVTFEADDKEGGLAQKLEEVKKKKEKKNYSFVYGDETSEGEEEEDNDDEEEEEDGAKYEV